MLRLRHHVAIGFVASACSNSKLMAKLLVKSASSQPASHKKLVCEQHDCQVYGECSWCEEKLKLDTAKQHVRQCQLLEKPCDLCHLSSNRTYSNTSKNAYSETWYAPVVPDSRKKTKETTSLPCAFKEEPCPLNCGATVKRSVKIFNSSDVIIFEN